MIFLALVMRKLKFKLTDWGCRASNVVSVSRYLQVPSTKLAPDMSSRLAQSQRSLLEQNLDHQCAGVVPEARTIPTLGTNIPPTYYRTCSDKKQEKVPQL